MLGGWGAVCPRCRSPRFAREGRDFQELPTLPADETSAEHLRNALAGLEAAIADDPEPLTGRALFIVQSALVRIRRALQQLQPGIAGASCVSCGATVHRDGGAFCDRCLEFPTAARGDE